MNSQSKYFLSESNIYCKKEKAQHRDEEYEEDNFNLLLEMQERHFWYQGRHRFLLKSIQKYFPEANSALSAIDLGGGTGGWLRYLSNFNLNPFTNLALGDSSTIALKLAETVLRPSIKRYQIDLMQIDMDNEWDAAFLLDVIEHIPNDLEVLKQTSKALKSGGYLFITTPAFPQFWSYNDDIVHHLRRYCIRDFESLANDSGLTLCDARYFMFYLSPLYLISRIISSFVKLTKEEQKELVKKQHRIPVKPINFLLAGIFNAETPIGHWIKFPWGTSILGVFRKK